LLILLFIFLFNYFVYVALLTSNEWKWENFPTLPSQNNFAHFITLKHSSFEKENFPPPSARIFFAKLNFYFVKNSQRRQFNFIHVVCDDDDGSMRSFTDHCVKRFFFSHRKIYQCETSTTCVNIYYNSNFNNKPREKKKDFLLRQSWDNLGTFSLSAFSRSSKSCEVRLSNFFYSHCSERKNAIKVSALMQYRSTATHFAPRCFFTLA
jgi:hypothetical protein